jgi:hypothetical protein
LEDREKSSQDDYVKDEVLVKNLEQEVRWDIVANKTSNYLVKM